MSLKELRKSKKITQKELSEAIGVSQSAISHIENGKRLPSMKTAQALSDELDCTIDDLFNESKEDLSES